MPWMELVRVTFTLAVIVAVIYGLAFALKRYGLTSSPRSASVIRVLATLSLGKRDAIYLVQVGNEQLVIGSGSGGLVALHTMKENVELNTAATPVAANVKFAELLRVVGKGWTP